MRRMLRMYFLIQAVCLCLTLLAAGTVIVKEQTQYTASGTQAAVRFDSPVSQNITQIAGELHLSQWADKLYYFPYPIGNIVSIISLFRNIAEK